ncbi:MAG TPA: 2OG-Fe(II) oxygenase [Gemmataceae bacterium]|jgi:peroxiredoxin|nr:2OG-Fe(II) oxygenase [Gemmataceae bacterium]
MFQVGEYVPWYVVQGTDGSKFAPQTFDAKYVVLCFFGSTSNPYSRRVLDDIERHGERFHGESIVFVGISADPKDAHLRPRREKGIYLCDSTLQLSRLHEVISADGTQFEPQTIILDPMQRVASVLRFDGEAESYVPRLLDTLNALPAIRDLTGYAPIIILPNVFEPEFCRALIGLYEQHGGREGAAIRDVGGKNVRVVDHRHKSRLDYLITDPDIREAAAFRLRRRLAPEIRRAFQFQAASVERHLVACYDAAMGGWFKAHRDNTVAVTAHRQFAVTINLNAEDYEGGDLCFPEYGSRLYRGPTGGAVVFSCTLLHEAKPVTKGRRFAYLPFLYDKEGYEKCVAAATPA